MTKYPYLVTTYNGIGDEKSSCLFLYKDDALDFYYNARTNCKTGQKPIYWEYSIKKAAFVKLADDEI